MLGTYMQGIIDQFRKGSKFVTRFLIRFSLLTLYKHSNLSGKTPKGAFQNVLNKSIPNNAIATTE